MKKKKKRGRIQKERKVEDDYIHSYVHHTGYERARCPKARPEHDGRHKPSRQAQQKAVMAPNK